MCTCFAVYHNENPIYGMNFDADEIPLNLSLNHINGTDVFYYQGYMNDECIEPLKQEAYELLLNSHYLIAFSKSSLCSTVKALNS